MLFLNFAYHVTFLFGIRISALSNRLRISIPAAIQAMDLELQVCSYNLNIGEGQLNIVLII